MQIPKYLIGWKEPGTPHWLIRSRDPFLVARLDSSQSVALLHCYPETLQEWATKSEVYVAGKELMESDAAIELFSLLGGAPEKWEMTFDVQFTNPDFLLCKSADRVFEAILNYNGGEALWVYVPERLNPLDKSCCSEWALIAPKEGSPNLQQRLIHEALEWRSKFP